MTNFRRSFPSDSDMTNSLTEFNRIRIVPYLWIFYEVLSVRHTCDNKQRDKNTFYDFTLWVAKNTLLKNYSGSHRLSIRYERKKKRSDILRNEHNLANKKRFRQNSFRYRLKKIQDFSTMLHLQNLQSIFSLVQIIGDPRNPGVYNAS